MTSFGTPERVDLPRGEDLPYDDGEPLETLRHRHQMNLLIETLHHAWKDKDAFIAGNMFIYFSAVQAKNNDFRGPDFFVVKGVGAHERRSWVVWEEKDRTPDLVVELLSESTAKEDRGPKKAIYDRVLKVPEYVLYDPWTHELEAFRRDSGTYAPWLPDPKTGRLASTEVGFHLGLWRGEYFGIETEWLRFYRPSGELVPTPAEAAQATAEAAQATAEAAQATAEAAQATADAAQARADRLAALLRAQGIEVDASD